MPANPPASPEWWEIPAGASLQHPDKLPGIGPWTVTFLVEGRKYLATVRSASGRAVLVGDNGSMQASASEES